MGETQTVKSIGQPDPVSHGDGKRRLSGLPLLAVALAVVLFVQALFVLSYIGALHDPKPHKVAIGVVGTSPLATVVGKQFSLKTTAYPSESAAVDAIDRRTIDGALVVSPAGSKLIVVPAAGRSRRRRAQRRFHRRRGRAASELRSRLGSPTAVR